MVSDRPDDSTTGPSAETYRFASLRQRIYESVIVVINFAVVTGLLVAVFRNWALRSILILAIAGLFIWAIRRAFRLEFLATSERVSIWNYWRSFEFDWADVTDVGLGKLTVGVVPQTAVMFLLRSGRGARAHATPPSLVDRTAMFEVLRRIAPSTVTFHDRD